MLTKVVFLEMKANLDAFNKKKKITWYRTFTNVNVSVLAFISFYIHLFYELPVNIISTATSTIMKDETSRSVQA